MISKLKDHAMTRKNLGFFSLQSGFRSASCLLCNKVLGKEEYVHRSWVIQCRRCSATSVVGSLRVGVPCRLGRRHELRGDLSHLDRTVPHFFELANIALISRDNHALEKALDGEVVVLPLIQKRFRGRLASAGLLGRLWRRLALTGSSLLGLILALAVLDRACSGSRLSCSGNLADVIVDSLHVVTEIPLSWEAMSLLGAFATCISAQKRLVPVTMQAMCLSLMAEKAGCGGKASLLTAGNLALVRLQVRVDVFAERKVC